MSNQYIIYNFRAEIQGTGSRSEVAINNCQFNKKLSCRKEVAQCSVSLKVFLSLKITQGH